MKKGKFLLAFIIGLMLSINVNAQSIFVSGDNLNDDKSYEQTMFRFGNNISSSSNIDGLNVTFGNDIKSVGKSDYMIYFGNNLSINETVEKDTFLFGNNVNIGSDAKLGRDVYLFGSNVKVNTNINGNARIGGETVDLSGITIKGNVSIFSEKIDLTKTKIKGHLKIPENAEVKGLTETTAASVEKTPISDIEDTRSTSEIIADKLKRIISAFFFVSIIFICLPRVKKLFDKVKFDKTINCCLSGLAILIALPIVSILLMVTGVFTGLSLLALNAYIVALLIAKMFTAYIIGKFVFKKLNIKSKEKGFDYLILLISLVGLDLICMIPGIGGLAEFFVLIYFLGLCLEGLKKLRK